VNHIHKNRAIRYFKLTKALAPDLVKDKKFPKEAQLFSLASMDQVKARFKLFFDHAL
jgi:hypothetical protein